LKVAEMAFTLSGGMDLSTSGSESRVSAQKRHTPQEVRDRVRKLLDQGLPISLICQRINITQSSAKRIRKSWEAERSENKEE
jgi:hypothetical protein